jgi:small subunit ribosomal protein S8
MMTDPLADMLTRIRNAVRIEKPAVDVPASGLKLRLAQVLKDEGYVLDYQIGKHRKGEDGRDEFVTEGVSPADAKVVLRVYLKYGPEGERVIRRIERVSKPGRRLYASWKDLKPVLDGLGIAVLSTNRGLMSDRRARAEKLGGEVLCTIW